MSAPVVVVVVCAHCFDVVVATQNETAAQTQLVRFSSI